MRILVVTGTRDPACGGDSLFVAQTVEHFPRDTTYVGDCPTGVDAVTRTVSSSGRVFRADWDRHKRAAGPIRNGKMLEAALNDGEYVEVLAFPAPDSDGTWDCIRQAVKLGIKVTIYPVGVK